ncbi:MAG: PIN domain-containing protein [Spirochaetaceae bacterium]|jgi:predicted nucleic acid-binding protein|nr:PIN domain-containing protein [Spirochaetaceae bacterium]
MSDKVFLDTNILLYAKIDDGTAKHAKARALLTRGVAETEISVSIQVINEYFVNALRKNIDKTDIETTVRQFMRDFNLVSLTASLVADSIRLFKQYRFSYWDSLIVAAALEAGCSILYSEDLQNGQIIDGTLTAVNPLL